MPSEPISFTLPNHNAAPNSFASKAAPPPSLSPAALPQLEADPAGSQAHATSIAEAAASSLQGSISKQGNYPTHKAAATGGWDSLLPDLETGGPSVIPYNPGNAGEADLFCCTCSKR